ncbi:glycosyl hydrolase family 47 protein [Nitzschia inconspicua]|uniref:Glycosyl hydrolase family 47 protein n=1 Tax=Nitzschia inconspicua TaxID=303405 RepID=A0A9K3PZJ5_9STRA|nr:glycosyl hydrolase family 47 protein [Nitzschia inconspicua]
MVSPRQAAGWRSWIVLFQCMVVWTLFLTVSVKEVTSSEQRRNDFTADILLEKGNDHLTTTNKLIDSIWKTFKQTFENTATSISSSLKHAIQPVHHRQDEQAVLRQRQREDMVNRRTLLFHKTVSDHYTQQVLQSSTAAFLSKRNDPHSNVNDGQEQEQRHQKRRPSVDQPPRPIPLRWQQSDHFESTSTCYCYSESSGSYWSFQWCPQHEIYQGRIDKTTGLMQPFLSLGKYTVPPISNNPTATSLVEAAAARYPYALSIDIHINGDQCDGHPGVFRVAAVVVHDSLTTERCSDIYSALETSYTIHRVDELRICQYIIHVCKSSSETKDTSTMKTSDASLLRDVSSMSESEATLWNKTILAAQHIIGTYHRETHVDAHLRASADVLTSLNTGLPPMPQSRIRANLKLIKDMFIHAYDSYMYHGYPSPEVKPITCKPATFDLVKIPGLTLIDSLDTLILMNNFTEFARAVERLRYLNDHLTQETGMFNAGGLFAINQNVSVFETNIRVLGGLLSAHQLAEAYLHGKVLDRDVYAEDGNVLIGPVSDGCHLDDGHQSDTIGQNQQDCSSTSAGKCQTGRESFSTCRNTTNSKHWEYDGFLLDLARDIGDRMLPAFKTQTGIPYGTVNLLSGVPEGETPVASLAGGGTLSLEMELLGRLTGEERYGRAAKLATRALWMRRSPMELFGKHICTRSGEWTEYLSGIGSNSDSFYEYLLKHHILFPEDEDFWLQFVSAYSGVYEQSRLGEWYADVDMRAGAASTGMSRRVFEALMAFYPGLQVLIGDLSPAARTLNSFFLVREYLGFLPERFNYGNWKVDANGGIHLLRPEILESAYFLHRATKGTQRDLRHDLNLSALGTSSWQWAGDFAVNTIEKLTRCHCGYASPRDISPSTTGNVNPEKQRVKLSNEMPSYFLSETLKYLYLLFDENNLIHLDGDRDWVFTTEAHPFHYQEKPVSRLDSQKRELQARIERRIKKATTPKTKSMDSLMNEKWTHMSDEKAFRVQVNAMESDAFEIYEDVRLQEIRSSSKFGYSSILVEPVVPEEIFHGIFDAFNERHQNGNPAYTSFRNSGSGVDLTMSCSNPYQSHLLWIAALNGGVFDYSQVYMSRVQDEVSVPNFRTGFIGTADALALLGSGLHISSMYDANSGCPARVTNEDTKHASSSTSREDINHKERKSSPSLVDMGDFGSFEVSAFPEGSGFLIQHVESGETIVTTLLNDGESSSDNVPESYILVYNTESADPEAHRSVVMADLLGNAYSCVIELVSPIHAMDEEPACMDDEEGEIASPVFFEDNGTEIVAKFPCAPALFGPTHVSNLRNDVAISVEAVLQAPTLGEEYGCSKPGGISNAAIPDKVEMVTGDIDADLLHNVCANNVISLIHRGICTFQEKSMNQKQSFNAQGVIVVNTEDDELFVMSGGGRGPEEKHGAPSDFPVTVLVTGSDGQAILDVLESHQTEHSFPLHARITLVQDQAGMSQTQSGLSIVGNKFWPAVMGGTGAIQIFSRSGWGVHATQHQRLDRPGEVEWQLLLITHEVS